MKEIKIRASSEYNMYVCKDFESFYSLLENYKIKKVFIITDENVYRIYEKIFQGFKENRLGKKIIKPGEESKNINTIIEIFDGFIKCDVDRRTTILSVGGGVVGDIAGFLASTYMRGIKLIHIPTTLLSQCDSSIGGKNGFNYGGIKNIIGTFYQPAFIFSDVNFLKTLNDREYRNGISEIVKYGFVCDSNLFKYIEENKKGIMERELDKLYHLVHQCGKIKGEIVEKDEFDTGIRHILNFGHTVGHAFESISNFKLSHGEAVSIGMNIESFISEKLGYIDGNTRKRLISILEYFALPIDYKDINTDMIMKFIKKDKKKTSDNIKFALPRSIGNAIITSELSIEKTRSIINEFIGREK